MKKQLQNENLWKRELFEVAYNIALNLAFWFNEGSSRMYEKNSWRPVRKINHIINTGKSIHYE